MKIVNFNFLGGKYQMKLLAFRRNVGLFQTNVAGGNLLHDKSNDIHRV